LLEKEGADNGEVVVVEEGTPLFVFVKLSSADHDGEVNGAANAWAWLRRRRRAGGHAPEEEEQAHGLAHEI
jgi:hypothetical protein